MGGDVAVDVGSMDPLIERTDPIITRTLMRHSTCRLGAKGVRGWLAVGIGIAAGWAFLIGLYLGFAR